MATIHHTTLTPSKLELLARWLPGQPWYRGVGVPVLAKAGGFRLDDPDGAVGIESIFAADADGTVYHLPLTYRGAPLPDDSALVGTADHGVLGPRWIYDAARDSAALAQLGMLARGRVAAQHQTRSDTEDPSVTVVGAPAGDGEVRVEVLRVLLDAGAVSVAPAGAPPRGVTRVVADVRPPGRAVARRPVAEVRSGADA